jgi:anti-sigma regulatory factor (Ser/Thr protein kinase)
VGADEHRVEVDLPADATAPAEARAVIDRAVAGLPGDLGFLARLAAGELVTNSALHSSGASESAIRLSVLRTGTGVRVEIRDRGAPFDKTSRAASGRATSGRGLQLVDALVDRWDAEHDHGNLIWFEIDQPAGGNGDPGSRPSSGRTIGRRERGLVPGGPGERELAEALLAGAALHVREGWCQGAAAVDDSGASVVAWSERATAWSLLGALAAALDGPRAVAGGTVPLEALHLAMAALAELIDDRSLAGWNDAPNCSQQSVIETLERARMHLRSGCVRPS